MKRYTHRHVAVFATLASTLSLVACGSAEPADAGGDTSTPPDARTPDASTPTDGSTPLDARPIDSGTEVGPADATPTDTGPTDTGPIDTGSTDTGPADTGPTDTGPADAGFVIPSSCTTSAECGPSASCVSGHCVCDGGALPCGTTCCPFTYARDLTLAPAGHAPEIGFDAAGDVFVVYQVGADRIRLATLPAGSTTPTSAVVATSSGNEDDADIAVAPDGTVYVAVHQAGIGRSGTFTLFTRAPAGTTFTSTSLRTGPPDVFAFESAVSISRAPGGDLVAGASARSGDGTLGLAMSRFDASTGTWADLPTALTASAYSRSELFARDDGFFLGVHDFPGSSDYFEDFDLSGAPLAFLAASSSVSTHGQSAAALGGDGVLTMFTGSTTAGRLDRSDGGLGEPVSFTGSSAGAHSDIDMALDQDGNPALLVHSSSNHSISLIVRMPSGGYTRTTWFDASFLPSSTTSTFMTLDLERLPSGNLAIVIGDSMDRGELHYRELSR